jgi:hypothetical protein
MSRPSANTVIGAVADVRDRAAMAMLQGHATMSAPVAAAPPVAKVDLAADMRRRCGLTESSAIAKHGLLAADMCRRCGITDESTATATAPKVDLVAEMKRLHGITS